MSAAELTATPFPSGVSPPPEVISSEDQSGVIAIIAGFALGLVLLAACIKLYARKYFRNFRHDDITFSLAIGIVIIQNSLVFYEIHNGLGVVLSNLNPDQRMTIRKAPNPHSVRVGLAADLFYIVILFLSKTCCALFSLWLAPDKKHKNAACLLIGASAVWAVTSLFVQGFRCPLGDKWPLYWQQCPAFFARWVYIGVFDMAIELALFLTSFQLIWNRHIPLSSRLAILGTFACRLPNIALTIVRLVFLNMKLTPEDSAYWESRVACTTQMAIGWSIFSCVIPYLRPLITAYERDGLSSKHPSSKISEPSSQSSRLGSRPPFHHPDTAHTVGSNLRSPAPSSAARQEDSVASFSRGSGGSSGGIEKTVKVELKGYEPSGSRSVPISKDTASGAAL